LKKNVNLRSIALIIFAAALTGCSVFSSVESKVRSEKERKHAPDFALKDITGQTVKLSDYHGKVVLLNFWATWCEPCQEEIPWFIDFQQSLKDRNFAVLGVSMDDDGWDSVKPFLEHNKINYRVVIGTEELSNKFGGIDALPTTFILDREGRIAAAHVGLVSKKTYQHDIFNLLDRTAPSPQDSVGSGSRRDIVPLVAAFLRAN
jgi:peroxiredoxin